MLEEAKQYPNIIDSHNLEVNWKNLMRYKEKVINYKEKVINPMSETLIIQIRLTDDHTNELTRQ